MKHLLAEPSCYIFASASTSTSSHDDVHRDYWNTFIFLQRLVDLNDIHIYLTEDLIQAVRDKFPYSVSHSHPATMYEAMGVVLRFLDRRAPQPRFEYGLDEATIATSELSRASDLYADMDVWPAWLDLLAKALRVSRDSGDFTLDVLSSSAESSCLATDLSTVQISGDSMEIRACRRDKRIWPRGLLDPDVFARMCARPRGSSVRAAWEDSGHQPSAAIKQVLVKTAKQLSDFVVRVGTTYRNPVLSETCKLSLRSNFHEIEFRISDGQETCKGCFSTVAADAEEQRLALELLKREYLFQCEAAGFPRGAE